MKRVTRVISLTPELARYVALQAKRDGTSQSTVIAKALRLQQMRRIQEYWSRLAKARGLLSEADLERYLRAR